MASLVTKVLIAGVSLPVVWTAWCLTSLRANISRGRATALPYLVVPCYMLGAPWLLTQPLLLPLLSALPESWTAKWLPLLVFNDGWHNGYEPFARVGADTFLTVAPGGIILYTCDAAVSSQVFRDGRLGKPAHLMSILEMFGPTITSTDGAESRLYRRITAPFFSEATMREVFIGSIQASEHLVESLRLPSAYRQLRTLTAKFSLHILNRFCYESESQEDIIKTSQSNDEPQGSHRMTYSEAVFTLLENYMTIFVMPHRLLKSSPFQSHRQSATAHTELHRYLQEMKEQKEVELRQRTTTRSRKSESILELLVQSGLPAEDGSPAVLRPDQIMGNIWVFVLAGHETNANTLTFIILLLACHPVAQRAMQADLDRILGDTPPDQWTHDSHYNPLMNSRVGAVINEALRLFTVLPVIPKYVPPEGPPVSITVDGNAHILPRDMIAFVNTSATHRHPKYWPRLESSEETMTVGNRSKRPFPASDFDPERWIKANASTFNKDGFLSPIPGTFIPFSEGSRTCLGYRFALVELCAAVAVLFKSQSVRLLTKGDKGGSIMEKDLPDTWEKARDGAELALSEGVKFDMSLRVVRNVPVGFETRG